MCILGIQITEETKYIFLQICLLSIFGLLHAYVAAYVSCRYYLKGPKVEILIDNPPALVDNITPTRHTPGFVVIYIMRFYGLQTMDITHRRKGITIQGPA